MATNQVLTVKELAAYLRAHPSTIYRMLKRHELPAFKIGSDWRFNLSQIEQFTQDRSQNRLDSKEQP